jgi:hypothetical protein
MRAYVWLLAGVLVLAAGVVQAQDTPMGGEVYRAEHTQARGGLGVRQDAGELERRGYEEGFRRGYQRSLEAEESRRFSPDPQPYDQPPFEGERREDTYRGGFGSGQMRIPFGEGQEALPGMGREEQLRRYEEGFARGYEEGRIRAQESPDVERRLDQDRRMMEQRDRGVFENDMRQQPRTDQQLYGTETRGGFGSGATMSPWGGTQDQQRGYDPYGPEGQRDFGTQQDQQRGFDQQTQPYGTQQEQPRFDEGYSQRYGAEQQNEFGTQQEQQRGYEQESRPYGAQQDQQRGFDQQVQPYGTQQDRQWQDQQQFEQQDQQRGFEQETQPYGTEQDRQFEQQYEQNQVQPYGGMEQPRAGEQAGQQQTFTGTVDRAGDMYVLIVNGRAYELEADEEETVRNMVGQQVDVQGTLEDRTIQAESINPSAQGMGTSGAQQ